MYQEVGALYKDYEITIIEQNMSGNEVMSLCAACKNSVQ